MTRGLLSGSLVCVLLLAITTVGCGPAGPATVPAKGTLTIDGQPANDVSITLVPLATGGQEATGKVANGSFTLFSGIEGAPGAVPGKYKVTLAATGAGTAESGAAAYGAKGQGGNASAAPTVKAPFPDKYLGAATSDKEVEITSGSNDLKIDITGGEVTGGAATGGEAPAAN